MTTSTNGPAVTDSGVGNSAAPAGIGGRAARGAAVTLSGQAVRITMQFAGVVVLARLLSPSDYGLLAMVMLVVGVGEIFRDFGLTTAAVQAPSLSRGERDGLFWINSGIGAAMALVVIAVADPIAALFNQPALTGLVRLAAVTFALNGLATQYRASLNRDMRFGRLVVADISGQVLGLAVGIVCAVLGAGYWALVVQQVSQAATVCIVLVVQSRWLPRAPWRCAPVGSFVRFGSHLAATQVIYYLKKNLDTLTIGLRMDAHALGIYNRGYSVLMSPLAQLRSPSTTVALPVLSRLQDDFETAGNYLRRSQVAFGYTIVAGLALCAGAAHPIVELVLGSQWIAVTPVFAYLAVAGAFSTLAYVGFWVYLSRGMGRELMRYTVVTLVLQAVCIFVGSERGINGVAAGYMAALAVEWPLSLWWLSRHTVIPLVALLRGACRVTVAGAAAGTGAWLATRLIGGPPLAGVVAGLAAGVAVYAVAAVFFAQVREDLRDVRHLAARMVRR